MNPRRYYSLKNRAMEAGIPVNTTNELLQEMCYRDYHYSAVIPYHGFLIFSIHHGVYNDSDYSSAVYRFDTDARDIGAPLTLVYLYYREFDDLGDATKTAIARAELIRSDDLMKGEV